MIKKCVCFIILLALVITSLPVFVLASSYDSPRVEDIRGDVFVYRLGGHSRTAVYRGMNIYDGDVFATGRNSTATLSYYGQMIIMGELTTLSVNSIWQRHGRNDSSISLIEGMVKVRVDVQLDDNSRNIVQAAGTIAGVRGTKYIMTYRRMLFGDEGVADGNPFVRMLVIDGAVVVGLPDPDQLGEVASFLVTPQGMQRLTEDIYGSHLEDIDYLPNMFVVPLEALDLTILQAIRNDPTAVAMNPELFARIDEAIELRMIEDERRLLELEERPEPQIISVSEASEILPNLTPPGEVTDPITESTTVTEVATEPITEPDAEPITEPTTEPVTATVTTPTTESTTEPVTEPTTEPLTEPQTEPITEPTEPATEPQTEPILTMPPTTPAITEPTEPQTEPVTQPTTTAPITTPAITEPTEPQTEPVTESPTESATVPYTTEPPTTASPTTIPPTTTPLVPINLDVTVADPANSTVLSASNPVYTFDVIVSGFRNEASSANLVLYIANVSGLEFTGYNTSIYNAGVRTFTVTVTLTDDTVAFPTGYASLSIGLVGLGYAYSFATPATTRVNVHDRHLHMSHSEIMHTLVPFGNTDTVYRDTIIFDVIVSGFESEATADTFRLDIAPVAGLTIDVRSAPNVYDSPAAVAGVYANGTVTFTVRIRPTPNGEFTEFATGYAMLDIGLTNLGVYLLDTANAFDWIEIYVRDGRTAEAHRVIPIMQNNIQAFNAAIVADDAFGISLRARHYVLQENIVLPVVSPVAGQPGNWSAIPSFSGMFDGDGFAIDGLTSSMGDDLENLGMFAELSGVVKNLSLTNVNMAQGARSGIRVGAIAAINHGIITNSSVVGGTINIGNNMERNIGGLVGVNFGTIEYSFTNLPVAGNSGLASDFIPTNIGGIVGSNQAGGIVRHVFALGNVSGNTITNVGGIAGRNYGGTMYYTFAINASIDVIDLTTSNVGRIVGYNQGNMVDISRHFSNHVAIMPADGNIVNGTDIISDNIAVAQAILDAAHGANSPTLTIIPSIIPPPFGLLPNLSHSIATGSSIKVEMGDTVSLCSEESTSCNTDIKYPDAKEEAETPKK